MTDTHALVWYLTGDRRLSKRAKEVFEKAEGGKAKILIPIVSLFEILSLIWDRRISFRHLDEIKIRIDEINKRFEDYPYQFASLDDKVLDKTIEISQINTPNNLRVTDRDLMIVAIALVNESVLITSDSKIRNSGLVEILW
jgi:PIN domain nuclease of toxin-antitoxin system